MKNDAKGVTLHGIKKREKADSFVKNTQVWKCRGGVGSLNTTCLDSKTKQN